MPGYFRDYFFGGDIEGAFQGGLVGGEGEAVNGVNDHGDSHEEGDGSADYACFG